MMQRDTAPQKTQPFMMLVLGTLVGVAVGLLMSPKSGRENRETLKRQADKVRDKVQHGRDAAMDTVGKAAGTAQEIMEDEVDMAGDIAADMGAKPDRKR